MDQVERVLPLEDELHGRAEGLGRIVAEADRAQGKGNGYHVLAGYAGVAAGKRRDLDDRADASSRTSSADDPLRAAVPDRRDGLERRSDLGDPQRADRLAPGSGSKPDDDLETRVLAQDLGAGQPAPAVERAGRTTHRRPGSRGPRPWSARPAGSAGPGSAGGSARPPARPSIVRIEHQRPSRPPRPAASRPRDRRSATPVDARSKPQNSSGSRNAGKC